MAAGGVQFDLVGWRDRRGRFTRATQQMVTRQVHTAKNTIDDLKKLAIDESPEGKHPFGTPEGYVRFKDSWKTKITVQAHGATAKLWNESDHAKLVFERTPEHTIRARRKKVLRFMGSGGEVVFRRSVEHPGTKGQDVVGKVMEKGEAAGTRELERAARDVQVSFTRIFQ